MKLFLLSVLLVIGQILANEDHGLQTRLIAREDLSLKAATQTVFKFEITNPNDRPITFLKWGTPFESALDAPFFQVVNAATGAKAVYAGRIIRRILPKNLLEARNEFVTLVPSETVSLTFDIAEAYFLGNDPTNVTTFEVSLDTVISFFHGSFEDIIQEVSLNNDGRIVSHDYLTVSSLSSEPIIMEVIGDIPNPLRRFDITRTAHNLGVDFPGCNSNQQNILANRYIPLTKTYANNAVNYLSSRRCDSTYVKFLGRYSGTGRWDTVLRHFKNIQSRYSYGSYRVQCENCNYYAYVYPSDSSHTIHLCNLSFNSPDNVNGETLIHEMSHFVDCGNTNDHVYGEGNAVSLAASNPDKAINCAENFCFFAEYSNRC